MQPDVLSQPVTAAFAGHASDATPGTALPSSWAPGVLLHAQRAHAAPEGPLAVHSAQPGVMWDPHASAYINNPQPHMQASRPLHFLKAIIAAWLHITAV